MIRCEVKHNAHFIILYKKSAIERTYSCLMCIILATGSRFSFLHSFAEEREPQHKLATLFSIVLFSIFFLELPLLKEYEFLP